MTGPLAQALGVGALDDHGLEVDAVDLDPADALPPRGLVLEQVGQQPDSLVDVLRALDRAQIGWGGEAVLERPQVVLGLALLDRAVDGRHGLLPQQGHRDVGEHDESRGDQRGGEDAKDSAHDDCNHRAAAAGIAAFAGRGGRSPRARLPASVPAQAPQSPRIASYQADPAEVGRVLLLYSGGLDTSVMLRWIQERYEAEVVTLTVDLGQPGEDWEVVIGKARDLGAADALLVDAREEFARDYVLPAIKANALYGGGYPLFTALGRPLIAGLAVEAGAEKRLRHGRPRLHREGKRPGANRGDDRDPCPRASGDRSGARVANGPRGGDRLCAGARHPGQGRHGGAAVLDRRQPLGSLHGGRRDRGPLTTAARRCVAARHPA